MQINLNYGKKGLPLALSDEWDVTVIRKPVMPVLEDTESAVLSALSNPVGSGRIAEEAKGCGSACIAVCDITRPVPNSLFLPSLLREITEAGIPGERITILIATGLHRPSTPEELSRIIGDEWVLGNFTIVDHYAKKDEDHVLIGTTSRGTPARIDRLFIEADLKIVSGLVEPHFMAGYSGGRKVISPGLCHADTICALHRAEFMWDPKSANCVLEGNPLHEDQLEILNMAGRVLAINTVIDEHRRLSFVNFGTAQESHLKAVEYARRYMEVPVNRKFKTVVTTNAGFPLDCNFYQTSKGIMAGMNILADGGTLLIASECSEGLGSEEFVEVQKRFVEMGAEAFLAEILAKPRACIDEWGTQMFLKALKTGSVRVYSDGLSDYEMSLSGCSRAESLEEAVRESIEEHEDNSIAIIPEGPYVIPIAG